VLGYSKISFSLISADLMRLKKNEKNEKKNVSVMKTGKQNLSTNLLLLSRNQVVAETERRALKFVQNGSIDIFFVNPHEIFLRGQKGELLHFRLAEKGWKKFALDEIDQ
jgi:predicted Zn-dependent protease